MTFNELNGEFYKMCEGAKCDECKYSEDFVCQLTFGYDKGRADKYQEIVSEYMLLTEKQVADMRAYVFDEIKQSFHNVYIGNLYCQEDMATDCKGHGFNCDDCLYVMFNKVMEQLKETKNE